MPVEACPLEIRSQINSLFSPLTPQAEQRGVGLKLRVQPRVPAWIISDPTRLQQVLSNLIGNALKFTHQGEVAPCRLSAFLASGQRVGYRHRNRRGTPGQPVSTFCSGGSLHHAPLWRDGTGLEHLPAALPHVGRRYPWPRAPPGQGSTFQILDIRPGGDLPEVQAQASGPAEVDFSTDLRILVAEDNLVNRRVLLGMLGRLGWSATVVENGRLGLSECQKQVFDLMILDVEMPEMDGLELIRRVRAGEARGPQP